MHIEGNIKKMKAGYDHDNPSLPVKYYLPVGPDLINLNELSGEKIRLEWKGRINCIHCGRETKKSFAQGYCYPCFISLPQTDACILHPEKCQAHLGISRDMEWAKHNCLQDHFVYLALTPGIKVGVTRKSQVPTRWIDQGAWQAIKLAQTPNRYLAGTIEVLLKQNIPDKTNWRRMLQGVRESNIDLRDEKKRIIGLLPDEMKEYIIEDENIYSFRYPVNRYPVKIKAMNFEKQHIIEGELTGIKGQYLIFGDGSVLNIRKFGGYLLDVYF